MQRAETHRKIERIFNKFSNGKASFDECILMIMTEIDLVFHMAKEETYKEILLSLNKPEK